MAIYTVVAAYPDARPGWAGTIISQHAAATPTVAARVAKRLMARDRKGVDADDIVIFAVFEGLVIDQYEPSLDTEAHEKEMAS